MKYILSKIKICLERRKMHHLQPQLELPMSIENNDCTNSQDVIDARNIMLANRAMFSIFSCTLQTFIDRGLSLCSEQACILDNLIYECALQDERLTNVYQIMCDLQNIISENEV